MQCFTYQHIGCNNRYGTPIHRWSVGLPGVWCFSSLPGIKMTVIPDNALLYFIILLYLQYLNSFCQCPVYLREPPDNPNGQTCKRPKCQWQLSMYMASIRKYLLKNKFLFKLKCLNFWNDLLNFNIWCLLGLKVVLAILKLKI